MCARILCLALDAVHYGLADWGISLAALQEAPECLMASPDWNHSFASEYFSLLEIV